MLGHQILDFDGSCVSSFWTCFYFSIITITTLGYGEMKPVHTFTRLLSTLEVSFGVIFLSVILSTALAFRRQ